MTQPKEHLLLPVSYCCAIMLNFLARLFSQFIPDLSSYNVKAMPAPEFPPESLRTLLQALIPLSSADYEAFVDVLQPLALAKKALLLREGEVCRHVAFVEHGGLRYFYTVNEEERTGQFFFEGAGTPIMTVFWTKSRPASASRPSSPPGFDCCLAPTCTGSTRSGRCLSGSEGSWPSRLTGAAGPAVLPCLIRRPPSATSGCCATDRNWCSGCRSGCWPPTWASSPRAGFGAGAERRAGGGREHKESGFS